jgi:putative membrane protein
MVLMRLVINGLTLILVAGLVPNIYFVDRSLLSILLMAVGLGILNAFVKPIIQFLTLQFIFATYGFVIVLINTIILLLLDYIFEARFYVSGLLWAIVGGLVMGVVASFLESLLGLNLPIVPKAELPEADKDMLGSSSGIFDSMLAEQPASGDDLSQPTAAAPRESGPTSTAATDEDALASDGEEGAAEEERPDEAQQDVDDEQKGGE